MKVRIQHLVRDLSGQDLKVTLGFSTGRCDPVLPRRIFYSDYGVCSQVNE